MGHKMESFIDVASITRLLCKNNEEATEGNGKCLCQFEVLRAKWAPLT